MKSKLFATTALAVVLTFGAAPQFYAFAQEQRQQTGVFNPEAERFEAQEGYYSANPNQILASDLIGQTVYAATADGNESIGDINDVIMNQRGEAQAIIIGVGGFLGLGEKDVAIDFSQVQWMAGDNGERRLTTAINKESLENAPAFDYAALEREYNRLRWGNEDTATNQTEGQTRVEQGTQTEGGTVAGQQQTGQDQMAAGQTGQTGTQQQTGQDQMAAGQTGQTGTQQQTGQDQMAAGQTGQTGAQQQTGQDQMAAGQTGQTGTQQQAGQNQQAAQIDRNSMQTVEMQEITAERVTGAAVYSADNENIGEVSEVLLTNDGQVSGFVVDVGGFLGMGERQVELKASDMQFSQDADGNIAVFTNMNRQQVEQLPERQS